MRASWLMVLVAAGVASWFACRPDTARHGDGDSDGDTDGDSDGDTDGDSDGDGDGDSDWAMGCSKVDILFVIDDSGSMAEEQTNLAQNFPGFIDLLEAYRTTNGTQLDYRVGITSTSRANFTYVATMTQKMGGSQCTPGSTCSNPANTCECVALGCTECTEDCPANCFCEPAGTTAPVTSTCNGEDGALIAPTGYTEPWIQGPGDHVSGAFSETAQLGTGGCGNEMPLYAAEHALSQGYMSAPTGPNFGFLRQNSLLMLIILTDEDDCSTDADRVEDTLCMDLLHPFAMTTGDAGCTDADGNDLGDVLPLDHYLTFLDGLMGGRNHWAAAVIAGETSCSTDFGDAYTAYRLKRFVEAVGTNGVFRDICEADLTQALDAALGTLTIACDEYELY